MIVLCNGLGWNEHGKGSGSAREESPGLVGKDGQEKRVRLRVERASQRERVVGERDGGMMPRA